MKYRGENYEPRHSKTNLTKGAFGKPKYEVKLKEIKTSFKFNKKQPRPLAIAQASNLIRSKYIPNSKTPNRKIKVDT